MNYQTPRGTYDILPEEMNAWHDVEDVIKEVTRVMINGKRECLEKNKKLMENKKN